MFNQYPYLNLNDLNLDYLLNEIKSMYNDVTNFVSINAIKYADPIQWNITSQYEKNTVVIDPLTGTAYISVAAVPSGVALTRTEYWTVVFDLGSFVTRAAQNFTSHWESDTTTTATFATSTGGWLVWGDVLYKALTNITAGDSYVVGGNIEHFTIEELYNSYLTTIDNILGIIGDLDHLQTTDKTSIVNAINELYNDSAEKIGDLADLDTDDKSNVVAAINENRSYIDILNRNMFVRPEQYGAKGDGVNDDTQAIIAALDASEYVLFEGHYHTTASIKVPDNRHLVGVGSPSGAYFIDQFNNGTFDVTGAFNVFFENLTFQSYAGSIESSNAYCIYGNSEDSTNYTKGVNIKNCWLIEGNAHPQNVKFLYLGGYFTIIHILGGLMDCGITDSGAPIEFDGANDETLIHDINISNVFFDALNSTGSNLLLANVKSAEIMNCTFRVKTTPHNIEMYGHDGKITYVNADNCTFISENGSAYGDIYIRLGAIFNDRDCARWNCVVNNNSIYSRLINNALTTIYNFQSAVLINSPTRSNIVTGGFKFTVPSGSDYKNYGVGFVWNTSTEYIFKLDDINNAPNKYTGAGLISNLFDVSDLIIPEVETNATLTPSTIDSGDLPATPTVNVVSRECYRLKEITWSASPLPWNKMTTYMKHINNPYIKIVIDHNTLICNMYISSDGVVWSTLFSNVNAAGYDIIGIAGCNQSGNSYDVVVDAMSYK